MTRQLYCAACGGGLRAWREPYLRCEFCRSAELRPAAMPDDALLRYADPAYHQDGEDRSLPYQNARIRWLQDALEPDGNQILEVGCGEGAFAGAALEAGFDVDALEPGSRFPIANARLGARVAQAPWETFLPERPGRYDAILAWEVIEHLERPKEFLAAALNALRREGVILMSTPNAASWSVRVLGVRDPMMCPDEHLRLFTPVGLSRLLTDSGFRGVSLRGFGYLEPGEVTSGAARITKVRLPGVLARGASAVSRLVRTPRLSLGLEVLGRKPVH